MGKLKCGPDQSVRFFSLKVQPATPKHLANQNLGTFTAGRAQIVVRKAAITCALNLQVLDFSR